MEKYQHAKIYFISNDVDNLIYVGSTIKPLNRRFTLHKSASKLYPERKIYKHFTKLGIDHFEIKLIKKYPCNNKLELEIEEERYKILLNAQLNTRRAHRTAEQLKEYKKEQNDRNNKIYYQKNRAKLNERILWKICGKMYTRTGKSQHCRSKRHQKCVQLNQSKNTTDDKFEKCVQFNLNI
jgi:hypothetical protein